MVALRPAVARSWLVELGIAGGDTKVAAFTSQVVRASPRRAGMRHGQQARLQRVQSAPRRAAGPAQGIRLRADALAPAGGAGLLPAASAGRAGDWLGIAEPSIGAAPAIVDAGLLAGWACCSCRPPSTPWRRGSPGPHLTSRETSSCAAGPCRMMDSSPSASSTTASTSFMEPSPLARTAASMSASVTRAWRRAAPRYLPL